MNKSEWLEACAARFIEKAKVERDFAVEAAEACLENVEGDLSENPVECADEEMSCWTND